MIDTRLSHIEEEKNENNINIYFITVLRSQLINKWAAENLIWVRRQFVWRKENIYVGFWCFMKIMWDASKRNDKLRPSHTGFKLEAKKKKSKISFVWGEPRFITLRHGAVTKPTQFGSHSFNIYKKEKRTDESGFKWTKNRTEFSPFSLQYIGGRWTHCAR